MPRFAPAREFATQRVTDASGDRKTETGACDAGAAGLFGTKERLKNRTLVVGGNADAAVGDRNAGAIAVFLHGDFDGSASGLYLNALPTRLSSNCVNKGAEAETDADVFAFAVRSLARGCSAQ